MARKPSRSVGAAIFIACIVGFIVYAWLLLASEWSALALKLTVLALVAVLLGLLAWIGLTIAGTPSAPDEKGQSVRELGSDEPQK